MSSKVARSERVLSAIAAKTGITEAGKQWLIAALDPFHDAPIHCEGFPDITSSASVVQVIKQSLQVSCPTGITTGTWDCNITLYPFLETIAAASGTTNNYIANVSQTGNQTCPIGGIVVSSGPTGFTNPIFTVDTSHVTSGLQCPSTYSNGSCRVIASGFEVINTTSVLNLQGLVTVWRSPCSNWITPDWIQINANGATTLTFQIPTYQASGPPIGMADRKSVV